MVWSDVVSLLHELNPLSIFVRLALATLCGGILGINRARKNRPAGFRTHMLVCLGATIVMMTNEYIIHVFGPSDPARLGAQVISGIGFLGAGTIVVNRRNQVLGLTTAAGLWASACIGLAIGIGFYLGAIIAALFLFAIVMVFYDVDQRLQKNSKTLYIYVEFASPPVLTALLSHLSQNGIEVRQVELIEARNVQAHLAVILELYLPRKGKDVHQEVIAHVRNLEDIVYVAGL